MKKIKNTQSAQLWHLSMAKRRHGRILISAKFAAKKKNQSSTRVVNCCEYMKDAIAAISLNATNWLNITDYDALSVEHHEHGGLGKKKLERKLRRCRRPEANQFTGGVEALVARAGHFRYFLNFSIIKNVFFCIFYQVNNLFLHQSYLNSPLPVKLT